MAKFVFKDQATKLYERKKFILELCRSQDKPVSINFIHDRLEKTEYNIKSRNGLSQLLVRMRNAGYLDSHLLKTVGAVRINLWSAVQNAVIDDPFKDLARKASSQADRDKGIYRLLDRKADWNSQPLRDLGKTSIGSSMGESYFI